LPHGGYSATFPLGTKTRRPARAPDSGGTMRKMGLCFLALITTFAFGSAKTYAQCATPTNYQCGCDGGSVHSGFLLSDLGTYFPSIQATCCSQVIPNIYTRGDGDCFSAKGITKTTQKKLAHLALHNRVFLVACNGDLITYHGGAAAEHAHVSTWSANRALSSEIGKVATRTR